MKNNKKYTLFIIAAGVLWAFISVFVKRFAAMGMDSFDILLLRSFFSTVIMLIFMLIFCPEKLKIRLRDIWMFFGTGCISLTMFNICYFNTIQKAGASVAVVLLYTSPIWVMLMSAVLFKERITGTKILALVMTFAGCVLVSGVLSSADGLSLTGLLVGICSGFGYALYSIFGRFALRRYDTLTVTFYTFAFAISVIFITHPVKLVSTMVSQPTSFLWAIGMALVSAVVPYILYTVGLSRTETSKAAIFATVEPLVASLVGIFAWHEEAGVFKIIGMALILASSIILSLPGKKTADAAPSANE
jgi:drug/metabolite transporter (DMT)-like permease